MRFSICKCLLLTIALIGLQPTSALADWQSRIMSYYPDKWEAHNMRTKIDKFTTLISKTPNTKHLSDNDLDKCFRLYHKLGKDTKYYSAYNLMFELDSTFIFPDDKNYDFDELVRPAREKKQPLNWVDYRSHDVIAKADSYYVRTSLFTRKNSTPRNFLNIFKEMEGAQGIAPCYIDYTHIRKKLSKLKSRVERDLEIQEQFLQFKEQVAGKSINDLSTSDIEFLNSILSDTEMVLTEVRFEAYNTAGLLLIRSDDDKIFFSEDRKNKQKAIYFWEYAALNGQSIDAMLNLFIHQNLMDKNRFLSIANSFSPHLNRWHSINKVGIFHTYSPRMQSYMLVEKERGPTPKNTLRLATYYMQHPAFKWHTKNQFMQKAVLLTRAGKNDLKKYIVEQEDRALERYKAEKTAEKIALWATLIGTTAVALGQLSDGGGSPSTTDDIFKGQMKHIDDVMVGAYAISLD